MSHESTPVPLPVRLLDLGRREYGEAWELQLELVARARPTRSPTRWSWSSTRTSSRWAGARTRENLVAVGDMPIFEIERGGDVTYHGPGQLVGYPILLLRPHERDLHVYLRNLEEALMRAVGRLRHRRRAQPGWTGVWIGDRGDGARAQAARRSASR